MTVEKTFTTRRRMQGSLRRLWQTALLMQWNPVFQYLPIENRIHEYQQEYYDAIAACHSSGNSNVFIEFMLDKINLTLDRALEQVSGEDAYLPETVKRLLGVMEYDENKELQSCQPPVPVQKPGSLSLILQGF